MWLLLIVLLAPPHVVKGEKVLRPFETYGECQTERNRIGFLMAEAYPHDHDFDIVCEFREKVI